MSDKDSLFPKNFLEQLKVPIGFVSLMWIVHFINILTFGSLRILGIYPRTLHGLIGIITTPFIHASFQHLISNSLPIFFLMTMLFVLYRKVAWQVFISLYFLTGIGVWLFARPAYHIGASGIVYALVSFLFWLGIFRRDLRSIAISLVILVLYSGYFMGIVPNRPGISWESHLMGGIAGIITAYMYRESARTEEDILEESAFTQDLKRPYFKDNTFIYTKKEREMMKRRDEENDWFSSSSF